MTRVLVGGVGYTNLRDLSLGPLLAERLAVEPWPVGVEVRDLGYGAVHVLHDLQDAQDQGAYERAVLFAAVERGREPGSVVVYRWDGVLPDSDAIQAQVSDAVTGVISLDSLLIVGRQFGALPDEILVVEVEPEDCSAGPGCSPRIGLVLDAVGQQVRKLALEGGAAVPVLPLG